MLLEFGFKNFLSFKEGASLSFRFDANVPSDISNGRDFSTILCVKGANGSGKTHLLKGLAFMSHFVTSSFKSEPNAEISIDPFYDSTEPSFFSATFRIDDTEYNYELSVSRAQVHHEALFKTKKRRIEVFYRKGDTFTAVTSLKALDGVKLRKNASLISTAFHHEVKELLPVFNVFEHIISNVNYFGLSNTFDINFVSKVFSNNSDILEFATKFIRECDVGIANITIESQDAEDGKRQFYPVFHHKVNDVQVPVFQYTESSGTKQLFKLLLPCSIALDSGGTLILDEFDLYLHPHILPKLVRLFIDPEVNKKNAQLIFSSHNSDLLDLCGRYRTYLVNKEDNQSYTYRLDEIGGDILRNDRSIVPAYNSGKIGGVPRL